MCVEEGEEDAGAELELTMKRSAQQHSTGQYRAAWIQCLTMDV